MAATDQLQFFVGAKAQKLNVRNYSNFKSHSPRYVDVQVIFTRFFEIQNGRHRSISIV